MLINVCYLAVQACKVSAIIKVSVAPIEDGNANYCCAKKSHIASQPIPKGDSYRQLN
jgi:hypothetical protein